MNAFYPAFSPACFSLLGLWLVVVQIRLPQWRASPGYAAYRKAAYGIALHFALPGLMSVLALVDQNDPRYWRTSFAIVALGGAVTLAGLRGLVLRPERGSPAGNPGFPAGGALGLASYTAAIVGYATAGVLAIRGGHSMLSVEEILLTGLVFLGFNAAWLLLFDDASGTGAGDRAERTAAVPRQPKHAGDSAVG
jgi:hypothetical protein